MTVAKHVFGGVSVYSAPLDFAGGTRRCREGVAVAAIAAHVFGAGARVLHHTDGAPYIGGAGGVHISVSHTRHVAVMAVSDTSVGIDAEEPREALMHVARRFLTPDEQRNYVGMGQLLKAWTLKEAAYKLLRPHKPATMMPLPPQPVPYTIVYSGFHPDFPDTFVSIVV